MNSARTLSDRFRTQRTDRIRVDGVEVLSLVELDVDVDEIVEVLIESARSDVNQALNLRSSDGGLVELSHQPTPADDFDHDEGLGYELVTVLASHEQRIEVASAGLSPRSLQLWNSWLMGDAPHSWTGNSGIVTEELDVPPGATSRVRLWCSDGLGDPQFDDLVAIVTVGKSPTRRHGSVHPAPTADGLEEE